MAKIVYGFGSSHGPLLSTPPERWVNVAREDLAAAYDGLHQPDQAKQFREELLKAHAALTGNR